MAIKNCENCGKVFADPIRDICRDCYYEEEEAFQTVYRFLTKKKNREATISEVVEATGVEEELIIKFLKQNRIRASQFPKFAYPCENCGVEIVEGRYCLECTMNLKKNIEIQSDIEAIRERRRRESEKVYYTINHNKKENNKLE